MHQIARENILYFTLSFPEKNYCPFKNALSKHSSQYIMSWITFEGGKRGFENNVQVRHFMILVKTRESKANKTEV